MASNSTKGCLGCVGMLIVLGIIGSLFPDPQHQQSSQNAGRPAATPTSPKMTTVPVTKPSPQPTESRRQRRRRLAAEKAQMLIERRSAQDAARVVFDVPSLIHKSINGVGAALGGPTDSIDMQKVGMSALKSWSKRGYTLLVDYQQDDGTVTSILIAKDNGSAKKKSELLQAGNLQEDAPGYSVEITESAVTPDTIATITVRPS